MALTQTRVLEWNCASGHWVGNAAPLQSQTGCWEPLSPSSQGVINRCCGSWGAHILRYKEFSRYCCTEMVQLAELFHCLFEAVLSKNKNPLAVAGFSGSQGESTRRRKRGWQVASNHGSLLVSRKSGWIITLVNSSSTQSLTCAVKQCYRSLTSCAGWSSAGGHSKGFNSAYL